MRLPIEFRVLGIKPGRWTPEVVVSRHNGLFRNVTQEVQYAQLVHVLGAERARELLNLHPGRPELKPDAALDLSVIADAVIETLHGLARRGPVPPRGRRARVPGKGDGPRLREAERERRTSDTAPR